MDERHWWFATKLQETFHIGPYDSPTMLEDFMAEQTTLDYINDFLAPEGHTKLFFYCPKADPNSLLPRKMNVASSCAKLKEVMDGEAICLYFIRSNLERVIDPTCVEKEVFCGEIKENPLVHFSSLLSEIFSPILHEQKDWGHSSEEEVSHFLNQLDKYTNTLSEYANATIAPQQILKKPESQVTSDFKQNRAAAVNPSILLEYENLVLDWIVTIENILTDGLEERFDPFAGPLGEMDKWKRRQKLLTSVTDQLKSKECKGVIAILITAKSKVLKRWKAIDASITDAFNETKDKVKYLESLRKYFDQLNVGNSLVNICGHTLPGLMASVRQMDAISRYYARNGYLGLLFSKITNQLVLAARDYIESSTTVLEEDKLWTKVQEEIDSSSSHSAHLTKLKGKRKANKEIVFSSDEGFLSRLNVCLSMHKQYRDMIRSLREGLGGSHSLSMTPSALQPGGAKRSVITNSTSNLMSSIAVSSPIRLSFSQSTKVKGDHESVTSHGSSGIAFTDEESIIAHLDNFCNHIRSMIDVIHTLSQFSKLANDVRNLPHVTKVVITNGQASEDDQAAGEVYLKTDTGGLTPAGASASSGSGSDHSYPGSHGTNKPDAWKSILESLDEEEEEVKEGYNSSAELQSISQILLDTIHSIRSPMEDDVTTETFLDVEGKQKERFEEQYTSFVAGVQRVESYICNYLKGVFALKLNIKRALEILTSFNCVMNRPGLRAVLSEKFLEVFGWFETELENVQKIYENQKESPPLVRNSPLVAGAITWSRGLLRKIEDPMKIFKENKFVTSYRDFGRIVKFYNRIATALVKFENLWLSLWKSRIDCACNGLKVSLLAYHPETKQLLVNADGRLLELIQESKSMMRMGIQLPDNALDVLKQEHRLKSYKQSLELVLQDYYRVCQDVPPALYKLLTPHMESVLHYLQPGVSTLNWSSMNIDAYLHQVHSANSRLKEVVDSVKEVVSEGIEKKIEEIRRVILFDKKLATAHVWNVERFVEEENRAVTQQGKRVQEMVKEVENALQEVVATANQRRISSPASPQISPSPSMSVGLDRTGALTPRFTRIGTIMSSAPGTRAATAVSGLTDESVIGDIFGHYCSLVYQAVLECIVSSLLIIGDCVKPPGRKKSGIEVESRKISGSSWDDSSDDGSESSDYAESGSSQYSEWRTTNQEELLQFEVNVQFNIPDIVIKPSLQTIQDGVQRVAVHLVDVSRTIMWWAADVNESFHRSVAQDHQVNKALEELSTSVTGLQQTVERQLFNFRRYDFLWKDDMHALYQVFVDNDPGTTMFKLEVERLQAIEHDVLEIPDRLMVGSVCLNTSPIKDSLHGFAVAWKMRYSTQLHEEAKIELDKIVTHRNSIYERLSQPVVTLDELNSAFQLLQELGDMENTIDDIYLPVENIYGKLREYHLCLPRREVEEVDNLRDEWVKLMELAEKVRDELLVQKRGMFEQELDKEVKAFVVNVIQFRNSFDSQGPGVPGVRPAEAVIRLQDFQQHYTQFEAKRKTLDSVQMLFGIVPAPFAELDKTGEELELLGLLYGLFQQFISFDQRFRDTLWSEVDLTVANQEMEHYWQECLRLPQRIQEWDAYKEMRDAIRHYLDVFPTLHKLNSKEIRNRHWLQVMSVTGSSFQLEAHIFKLVHLLDIGLLQHQAAIEEICRCASRELELEAKMRSTEEEWTEQVLTFENFKNRGLVCLSHRNTEHLLDLLEDAQATLALMLTSRHIGPLRDEAAAWAIKLKEISEVLEQWLTVQDLWQHLEEVFSHSGTAKDLPQEYNRFARVDKSYMKMMKRAYETRNVLQCCVGGDVPKSQMLKHLGEELEICFKSLVGFLDSKRKVFPRFCFVNDPVLLAILSQPYSLDSVQPYFRCIFNSVRNVILTQQGPETVAQKSSTVAAWRSKSGREDSISPLPHADTFGSRFRKISGIVVQASKESEAGVRKSSFFPSTLDVRNVESDWHSHLPKNIAVAVTSEQGETLELITKVPLVSSVDVWLAALLKSINESLRSSIVDCIQDIDSGHSLEEWIFKYPSQTCRLGLLYIWTKECEAGIGDIRIDRKAMPNASRRFWSLISKLPNLLAKGSWKHTDSPMTSCHKLRLETLVSQGMYLRDVLEDLGRRKLRDVVDFEWKRNIRFYGTDNSRAPGRSPLLASLPSLEGAVNRAPSSEPPKITADDKEHEDLHIHMLDAQLSYGFEFYGCEVSLALTPITERCFLSLTQAVWNVFGGSLVGPTGTGKTETIKGLASLLGRYLVSQSCSPKMSSATIGKIIVGLAEEGCWGLMDEFHKINMDCLSVMLFEIQAVLLALRGGLSTCTLEDGKDVTVQPNFSIFLTICSNGQNFEFPPEFRALFRSVAMVMPDSSLILRAYCAGQGFKSPKILSDRLKLVGDVCKEQLSGKSHHNFSLSSFVGVIQHAGNRKSSQGPLGSKLNAAQADLARPSSTQSVATQFGAGKDRGSQFGQKDKKPTTPSALSSAARLEHSFVLQSLQECIGPRLSPEELNVFNMVIRDVFYGLSKPPAPAFHITKVVQDFETVLLAHTREKGFVAHQPWIAKIHQLWTLSKVHRGIIVAGPPGTGKSSCISGLVETLSECSLIKHKNTGSQMHTHKLQRINPLAVSDSALMFGKVNTSSDFEDGIFTAYFRKANKDHSVHKMTTWLCLDAPLHQGWAEFLSSALDKGEYLNLLNGERLYLSEYVKLIFETDDLTDASPSTVSRCGLVYMDETVLGWRPLAEAWLANRSPQESHCLQRAFNKTVDVISQFVHYEARPFMKVCEVGLFNTCLALLKALIEGNTDIGGELHIERLYLFSLIWSFGGLLDETDRKKFSELLLSLTTALPDYDQEISVFDYYVDESGEWDPWQSRVPEVSYFDAADLLGEVFVDTIDTIRTRQFMELASASGRNILLTGPAGCGKTSLIGDFLDKQEDKNQIVKRYVYSGTSGAAPLQQFIEHNIYHRQGFVYGAKRGKILNVFIDDLSLPQRDQYGTQEVNELLRQVLDEKVLFNTKKPFDRRVLEGVVVTAAMNMQSELVTGQQIPERLKRHFAVFRLPAPSDESLFTIVTAILEANMAQNQGMGLPQEFHEQIVMASCMLLNSLQDVLRPSPTPGRCHYLFNLREITRVFQGLKNCSEEMQADEEYVVSLWQHEVTRVVKDRICRSIDIKWFEKTLKTIIKENFPELPANSPSPLFITFPLDAGLYAQRPVTQGRVAPKILLQAINNIEDVSACLQSYLKRYNDEFSGEGLDLMISSHVMFHVVRLHRILSYKNRGNALLIGSIGTHLNSLAALALYMLEYPIHPVDCTYPNTFLDGLRSAVRQAGCDGKTTTVLFTAPDLRDDMYLDALNSLLISGEYPPLFSVDELDSLLQALMPAIKKKFSNFLADPMKFFITRVKANLHIILCLPPTHKLLRTGQSCYPGILYGCQMDFVKDWPQYALEGEASHYLEKYKVLDDISEQTRDKVVASLSTIHGHVLRECHQIPWAGDDHLLTRAESPPEEPSASEPRSLSILLEKIKLKHQHNGVANITGEVFVGPTTYIQFMHCFRHIFRDKRMEANERVDRLTRALETLEQTRKDSVVIKDVIAETKKQLSVATVKSDQLLEALTAKATAQEKLKAKLGIGSATLSAFVALIGSEIEDDDLALLQDDEADELDEEFEKLKKTNIKSRRLKVLEEISLAEKEVEDTKVALKKAEEQVKHWMYKVDRSLCERLRAFQSPPPMAGMVMVMVMVLLGRPEFAPGIGGAGSTLPPPTRHDRRGDHSSSLGTGSDEASRASSATHKKRSIKEQPQKVGPQAALLGVNAEGKIDRSTWKAIQQIMNDSQKFVESLHHISRKEGLHDDILKGVQSFLAASSGGDVADSDLRTAAPGASASTYQSSPGRAMITPEKKPQGITITAAKYSSEDAAVLVEYTVALVEYTRLYNPYKKACDALEELMREREEDERQAEIDKNAEDTEKEKETAPEPEVELTEADLPGLQETVTKLQKEYDEAVVVKHDLGNDVRSCSERLKAATDLLHSLKYMEREWKAYVDEYTSSEILLSNCIAGAAFLTYCGAMGVDRRKRMGKFFMQVCRNNGLKVQYQHLFDRHTLPEFLKGKIVLKTWENMQLPTDPISLDTVCIFSQEECSDSWALLCDPQRIAITWVLTMLGQSTLVKYKELRGHLETCLMEGTTLVVTDVDVNELEYDSRFYFILRSRYRFLTSSTPFKLMVGEHEIECQPGFRLVLVTTFSSKAVPSSIAAYVNVVEFSQSRDGLEEMFLDRFLRLEKPRMQETRTQAVDEMVTLMEGLREAEENILECLGSGHRLLHNLAATKKLASIKKQHEEIVEGQTRSRGIENSVLQSREGYRPIARRAAVMFDVARIMAEINTAYQTSLAQFLMVFDAAIKHSERTAVKAVVERLTQSAFYTAARALFERDRPLFSLLCAIEVEDSSGRVGPGDREFLIHPSFGAAVKTALQPSALSEAASRTLSKKPFDWLLDEQYSYLQLLATHFEWFQDAFDKMTKDGRETQWRQITEHDKPELVALPDGLDDKFTLIQRFMVIRSLRGDRLMPAATCFITSVLGKKYTTEIPLDLPFAYRQSESRTPIVLLYTQEANMVEKLVIEGAQRKQVELHVHALANVGIGEERAARKTIHKAIVQGHWVLLHNAHNSPRLLAALDSFMQETKAVDSEFRLWVSVQPHPDIPSSLLQSSVKVVADSPKSTKDSLQRSLQWVDSELMRVSMRPEWPALLHNLCMLHSLVRLRTRFGLTGWNKPMDLGNIGTAELWQGLELAVREFQDNADMAGLGAGSSRSIQWNGLRYMLAEAVYGRNMSDEFDRQGLSAMIDYWISPAAVKREFEASKIKYKLPSALFSSNVKLNSVWSALEGLAGEGLEAPEACGLHSSPETQLGDEQYVFTRLNYLLDRMASSDTLTHAVVEPSTLIPSSGVIQQSSAVHTTGAGSISIVGAGVFASASLVSFRNRKEVDLNEVCTTMLAKIPKVWSKESVYERMKKTGGPNSFNLFVIAEMECMHRLLACVRETLLSIKAVTGESLCGDRISEELLDSADDLYHMRIPSKWSQLGGDSSPPPTWSLAAWFTDLGNRFSHIDRIIVQGRERVPAYWLGAFFNPRRFLSIIKQEAVRNYEGRVSGTEPFVYQTEITGRDKDHLREPPLDGMFVYGIYLWGCAWEKTTGDLLDAPPKSGPTPLPVVHIVALPQTEKASLNDPVRAAVSYSCPCYSSRISQREPVMLLDVDNKDVPSTRWPLRGLSSTLRPF